MTIQEVSFRREVVTFTTQSRSAVVAPAQQCTDSVSLSPAATAGTKAEKLVSALDADKDGAISDKEFIDGGTALLRRASHRRHSHDDDGSETKVHGHGRRGLHRLERRLERLFDKVDANGDGALDARELTAALTRAAAPPEPKPEETTTEPAAEAPVEGQGPTSAPSTNAASGASAPASFSSATYQFTFVLIAVHQYQVSEQEQTPAQPQLQATA